MKLPTFFYLFFTLVTILKIYTHINLTALYFLLPLVPMKEWNGIVMNSMLRMVLYCGSVWWRENNGICVRRLVCGYLLVFELYVKLRSLIPLQTFTLIFLRQTVFAYEIHIPLRVFTEWSHQLIVRFVVWLSNWVLLRFSSEKYGKT